MPYLRIVEELVPKILILIRYKFFSDIIAFLIITKLSLIIVVFITHINNIMADNDNDNDEPNPQQLGGLRTCTI